MTIEEIINEWALTTDNLDGTVLAQMLRDDGYVQVDKE